MKIKDLRQLVKRYDQRKGLSRRLFGDALPIKVLKQFIAVHEMQSENSDDLNFTLFQYTSFATSKDYKIDLSAKYLNSGSESSLIFKRWYQEGLGGLNRYMQSMIQTSSQYQPVLEPITLNFQPIQLPIVNYQQRNYRELFFLWNRAETHQPQPITFTEDDSEQLPKRPYSAPAA